MPDLCPLWGDTPVTTLDEIDENGVLFVYSPRAGGVYRLTGEWRWRAMSSPNADLMGVQDREKANLSHWIYCQNRDAGLLWPLEGMPKWDREDAMVLSIIDPKLLQQAPRLDPETVAAQSVRTPSALDRRLTLLRELLRQQDIPRSTDENKLYRVCRDYEGLRAAAAAWETDTDSEAEEFWEHLEKEGWVRSRPALPAGTLFNVPAVCTLDARLWVEDQLRERGTGQRVFVAMGFDKSLDAAYTEGLKQGIAQAGYEPYRVDQDAHHSDKLDDRVLAGLRQSRIVVADFTCETFIRKGEDQPEGLPNGNVHYEAGFAHGRDMPVIYTCREDCQDYLRFDTRQINHILWTDAADLARQLQARLEGQFGHGPVQEVPDA